MEDLKGFVPYDFEIDPELHDFVHTAKDLLNGMLVTYGSCEW